MTTSRSLRFFVLLAVLVLLGCDRRPAAGIPPDAATTRRVVVVGAGLAGLTAALDLVDAGWDVVVLEARDRVGGRVHTLSSPFDDGLHAEGGGESIDDTHDRIQALVTRFGLGLERRPANKLLDGVTYYMGQRSNTSAFVAAPGVLAGYDGFASALLDTAGALDPEHPESAANATELDARSLDDFIKERAMSPAAEFLTRASYRASYNAEADQLSLLFVAQQEVASQNEPDSAAEAMRITGGNSLLPEAMAAALGTRVHLSSPVTRVEEHADGVWVTAGGTAFDADYVVMAIPTPPLRNITFDPPLSGDLGAAVAGVDLGTAVKVVTEYTSRFWEPEGYSGFTVTDLPFGVGWSPTDSYASTSGLLTQFITGRAAIDAAALDDATRIAQFQSQLDVVYPEGVASRTSRAATIAWADEPYSGGGYTIYKPGQFARFWPALRAGTARIQFAGEHLDVLIGYMESAVRSGHRAAQQIDAATATATATAR